MRLALAAITLLLTACVSAPVTDPARLPAGVWELDSEHTSVTWQVRHLGLSWYTARFDGVRASLQFDPANPEAAELTAIVDAASVSTGDPDFDQTLRGRGWLDAARHPEIVFVSNRIVVTGERAGEVHGLLTLKGVTHPVIMETEFYGGVFNPLIQRNMLGFRGYFEIDRTQFNVGRLPGNFIGDTVRLSIEAEFVARD
ncbi:YceI family protein [Glycocaulis sp.]|uniref:YceI family protein n=1 Tax=Glycocaulis sp. TaxID=1969725 RepID=UPI003D249B4D